MRPDPLAQDAQNRVVALEPGSFIVEAPAGAGKTELLSQRYLRLLAEVQEPEEIIAITFTNKAAAEMRDRVLQALQEAADGVPVEQEHRQVTRKLALQALAHARLQQWDVLAQPGRLRINTIDSLCGMLARQMPLLSRFGSQPAVSDDPAVHYTEAARRTLAMLEQDDGDGVVEAVLRYFDNDMVRLEALLGEMLARRDQWLHLAGQRAPQAEVEAALQQLLHHDMRSAVQAFDAALQARLMPLARYAAANLPCEHPVALLADWDTPIPAHPEAMPLWRSLCELLLTGSGEWRRALNRNQGFPATEEGRASKQVLLDILAELPAPQALARIRALPEPRHGDAEWRIVGQLGRLLQLAAAHLWTVFQESGEVDFVEVASRALQALGDDSSPTDLALRLDYRIRHLLVDEFQDTSPGQVELLRRLTLGWQPGDGRTLFCVGDPMQSIYRFRKADVGLFLQAASYGIGPLHLEPLHLSRNNRSCPAVVDWVNRAFADVFPLQDSETRGGIRYRPFVATRDPQPGDGVITHPLVLESASSDTPEAVEARHVADLIEQERAAFPGRSIAVLVRARAHLEALVAEIRRERPYLRFQAVEIELLAGRQSVQDVLALTRALFHLADRVNWLAVLRAPWCGLRLADLHALAGDDHAATIWQLMQDDARLARLSEDGRQRLEHVRGILADALAYRGRLDARRWVEAVWLRLSGPRCLWDAGDVRDVNAFFGLIERMEGAGQFDPDRLEEAMAELYAAADVQADGSLQFMTIHKSKGLEFDSVILPGLHRQARNADAPLLLWEEVAIEAAEPQLVAAPWVPKHKRGPLPSTYDYLQGLEKTRTENEAARVLYVAATRARRRLHLVGALRAADGGEVAPLGNSFLAALWPVLETDFLAVGRLSSQMAVTGTAGFIPGLMRLPQLEIPRELKMEQAAAGMRYAAREEEEAGDVRRSAEADYGTLAHLYMEMLAQDGPDAWQSRRWEDLLPVMCVWLMRRGHERETAESGARAIVDALQVTLASGDGRWVLQPRTGASNEMLLASLNEAGARTHRIDRTFVERGERWIIDYKLARFGHDAAREEFSAQAEGYRPQLERYAGLFLGEGLPVRMAVYYIAYGMLVELNADTGGAACK